MAIGNEGSGTVAPQSSDCGALDMVKVFARVKLQWRNLPEGTTISRRPPHGGRVCFSRYRGGHADEFCRELLQEEGVLLLPPCVYTSEIADVPMDHFPVGLGRLGFEEGLAALERYLAARP